MEKGVHPKNTSTPIVSVSDEIVASFVKNGHPSPDIVSPMVHWSAHWSSPWNTRVRSILVDDFLKKVKAGDIPSLTYDEERMTPQALGRSLTEKLNHHRKRYKGQVEASISKEAAERVNRALAANVTRNRHGGQRQGVIFFRCGSCCLILTHIF